MEKLRIILTSRCELQCRYCQRRSEDGPFAEREAVLRAAQGAADVELAGGDPLLYPDICGLVRELRAQPGLERLSLATNGVRLAPLVTELKAAGLDAVDIHIDSCNAWNFEAITGRSQLLNEIQNGLWSSVAQGLEVSVTSVLLPETLSQAAVMASLAKHYDITVRFLRLNERAPGYDEALALLGRYIKGLGAADGSWRSPELRGKIVFGAPERRSLSLVEDACEG